MSSPARDDPMKKAKANPRERTTLYLTPQLKLEMARAAEEAGQSWSTWVERLIASHIKAKVAAQ
jgi:hypothetical protein